MTFTEIVAESRRFVGDKGTQYDIDDITGSANRALDRVTSLIREAQNRWQLDDSNYSDFPIATTTITTDQQDYSLDPTHYRIERFEVLDTNGGWHKLIPIDQADLFDTSLTDFLKTAGVPQYYDKVGNSIFLYPTPNYTQVASLKAFYERGPSYFTESDTTKSPGFNPLFHRLISLWCAYDYAFINQMAIGKDLFGQIAIMEDQLTDYYSLRDIDDRIHLATRGSRYNFR